MAKPVRGLRIFHRGRASEGLTLMETMVAMALLGIVTIALLLLFTSGTGNYNRGKAQQESLQRIRRQVPLLLQEIRGAVAVKTALSSTSGSPSLAFTYRVPVGGIPILKWIQLTWNPAELTVTRVQRAVINPKGDPDLGSPPEETRVLLSPVDSLQFFSDPDYPGLVIVEYQVRTDVPAPLVLRYKVLATPKFPVAPEENDEGN